MRAVLVKRTARSEQLLRQPNLVRWYVVGMAAEKVKGPASYFPSIEKKYGYPVAHWFTLLKKQKGLKHMELVAWLKGEHNLGHGHANALVAYFRAKNGE